MLYLCGQERWSCEISPLSRLHTKHLFLFGFELVCLRWRLCCTACLPAQATPRGRYGFHWCSLKGLWLQVVCSTSVGCPRFRLLNVSCVFYSSHAPQARELLSPIGRGTSLCLSCFLRVLETEIDRSSSPCRAVSLAHAKVNCCKLVGDRVR